ncbi:MAG: translation initiation factor IF-2 subunit gamma [Haloarculaceae archaeon]
MSGTHRQPEVNIGLVGHVDHGKTTLVQALSGQWTDQHSEEMKRGISIRLGYADATFRRIPGVDPPECFTVEEEVDGEETEMLRTVSFVDAPGHETLMATMLSGAAIMDGAVLVIGANEPVPQAQTEEHLMALDIIGIDDIVIAQNKIDLVADADEARRNKREIESFIEGTVAEGAPIVPVSAQQEVNVDLLIAAIEEEIPTPERDSDADPRLQVARSFDINRPGTTHEDLKGGVVGGSLSQGVLEVGDDIEIRPGRQAEDDGPYEPVGTSVRSLQAGGRMADSVRPGGLVGVGTGLDPSVTKGDALAGQVAGPPGTLPPVHDAFTMSVELLDRVVGEDADEVEEVTTGEPLMLTVGTATTVGAVTSARSGEAEVRLKRPVCADPGAQIAINRRVGSRWRLIGVGTLE